MGPRAAQARHDRREEDAHNENAQGERTRRTRARKTSNQPAYLEGLHSGPTPQETTANRKMHPANRLRGKGTVTSPLVCRMKGSNSRRSDAREIDASPLMTKWCNARKTSRRVARRQSDPNEKRCTDHRFNSPTQKSIRKKIAKCRDDTTGVKETLVRKIFVCTRIID